MNKKIVLISITAVILLIIILFTNKTTSNAIFSAILPAKSYYKRVENNNIKEIKKNIKKNLQTELKNLKKDANLGKNTSYEVKLEDGLSNSLQLPDKNPISSLKSIKFSIDQNTKKNKTEYKIKMLINNTDIITADLILDYNKNLIYIQIPELFDRWFSYNIKDLKKEELEELELNLNNLNNVEIETKSIINIIDKYSKIILANIKNVKVNKKVQINIEEVELKTNEIVIEITKKEVINIINEVITEAKKDEELYNICKSFDDELKKDMYKKGLDEINKYTKENACNINIKTYVNKKGEIIGRSVKLKNKNADEVIFYKINENYRYNYSNKETNTEVIINNKKNKEKNSGKIKIIDNLDKDNKTNIITYKNFYIKNAKLNGNLTMKDVLGEKSTIEINLEEENNYQNIACTYSLNKNKMITISVLNTKNKQDNIIVPKKTTDITNLQDDNLLKYNLLLELNNTKPIDNLEKAIKNKEMISLIDGMLNYTNIKYFNGKQTPMTLYQLGKTDEEYSKIFKEGYGKTIKGQNPGLGE